MLLALAAGCVLVRPALAGTAGISGRVLRVDGSPLANIRLSDGRFANTVTDAQGFFTLTDVQAGKSVMRIDGRHGGADGNIDYGTYEVQVKAAPGRITSLPFVDFLTPIDHAHDIVIASPTTKDMVVRSPLLPGVALRIPAGTVLTDWDGKRVNRVSLTPVDVDHPPFPLPPEVRFSSYFTAQPGGTRLWTLSGARAAATIVYPNRGVGLAGAHSTFWHYHPETVGWIPYGTATVSADGNSLLPDAGATVYDFMGGGNPTDPSNSQNKETTNQDGDQSSTSDDGEPVDLGSGFFSTSVTDLSIADVIPITVSRAYISSDAAYRDFGLGMSLSYEIFGSLVGGTRSGQANEEFSQWQLNTPSSTINFNNITPAYGDYSDALFVADAQPGDFLGARAQWTGNGFSVTRRDGMVYAFGYHAPLIYMQDRFGNRVSLTYQQVNPSDVLSNRPVKITSPNGRFFQFTWTDLYPGGKNNGFSSPSKTDLYVITSVADNLGRQTQYSYDACGRLLTVADASALANGTGAVTTYGWSSPQPALGSGACLRASGTPPLNLLQSVTDQSGNLVVYTLYQWGGGPHGEGATCETYLGGGAPKNFTTGRVCKQYLANPNLASGASGQGSPGSFNPLYSFAYTIDPNENILAATVTAPPTNLVNPASHTHVVKFLVPGDACGATSCSSVAPPYTAGYPVSETFAADAASLAQTWITTRDPGSFVPLTVTAPPLTEEGETAGRVTAYCYDNTPSGGAASPLRKWNLTSVVRNLTGAGNACPSAVQSGSVTLNATTLLGYSPVFNQVTSVTDPNGNTTTYCRGAAQPGCGSIGADPLEQVLAAIDANGNSIAVAHAPDGQVTGVSQMASTSATLQVLYGYDHADMVSVTQVGAGGLPNRVAAGFTDGIGRTIQRSDPLAGLGTASYDPIFGPLRVTDANGSFLAQQYQANGAAAAQAQPNGTTAYTYNAAGLQSAFTDPLNAVMTRIYDQAYNLVCTIDRRGNQASYTYDALNRLQTATYYLGATANCSGTPAQIDSTVSYGYDHGNRVLSVTDSAGGTIARQWDDLDRLTLDQQSTAGGATPIGTVSSSYDLGGRTTQMAPSGQAAEGFVYDKGNRLVAVTSTGGLPTLCYTYDGANRRTALVYPYYVSANDSFDVFSDLLQIAYTGPGTYTPGANGAAGTCTPGTATGKATGTLTYAYDQNGRQIARGNAAQGSAFPGFSLVLPPSFGAGTVGYNADNQLVLWNGLNNLYDGNGNLTCLGSASSAACTGAQAQSLSWDARNRLTAASAAAGLSGANAETYAYDGLSRRQSVSVPGAAVPTKASYLYDGLDPVSITTVNQATGATIDQTTLLIGRGLDRRMAITSSAQGGGAAMVLTDSQDSVIGLQSGSAAVAGQAYPAFGGTGGASFNPFRYTGREASDNTRLYFYRGRSYAPALARFVQEDPLGFIAGVNFYAYVLNDPLDAVDPLGWDCNLSGANLVAAAQNNATHSASTGNCAKSVRQDFADASGGDGLNFVPRLGAGGTPTFNTVGNALVASGCYQQAPAGYTGKPADVAVTEAATTGHISIDIGPGSSNWASDYVSPNANPGGRSYVGSTTRIYQYIGPP